MDASLTREARMNPDNQTVRAGVSIPVDLDKVIECIYVSHTCENWFKELVESVLDKYGLKKEVRASELGRVPLV
jgi:hypothetical protein